MHLLIFLSKFTRRQSCQTIPPAVLSLIKSLNMETLQTQTDHATLQINEHELSKGKAILRAVNHSLRRQILELIHHQGKITVTEIYQALKLEQSVASQHLAILRHAALVNTKREGKCIFYSVNYKRLEEVHEISKKLITT